MSGIVGGYFPHLRPTTRPAGAGARVPPRGEEESEKKVPRAALLKSDKPEAAAAAEEQQTLRQRIMAYARELTARTGDGPTLSEVEEMLGPERFLAQQHVYWLEGHGHLRAERVDGGRRRLRPTSKELPVS